MCRVALMKDCMGHSRLLFPAFCILDIANLSVFVYYSISERSVIFPQRVRACPGAGSQFDLRVGKHGRSRRFCINLANEIRLLALQHKENFNEKRGKASKSRVMQGKTNKTDFRNTLKKAAAGFQCDIFRTCDLIYIYFGESSSQAPDSVLGTYLVTCLVKRKVGFRVQGLLILSIKGSHLYSW